MRIALATAYISRCLETIHARHVHVEQDHGKVACQQFAQGCLTGFHGNDVLAQFLQHGVQHQPVFRPVVDHEYGGTLDPRRRISRR